MSHIISNMAKSWNQMLSIQGRYHDRLQNIKDISYKNSDKIHHGRIIVIESLKDWNLLFCHEEKLNSNLNIYSKNLYNPFPFECKVTLILEHNYRQNVHLAVFIIHLNPHRQFLDGHAVLMEFGDKSQIHHNIEQLFDLKKSTTRIVQMSEYDMLRFMANDDNYADLLYGCFYNNFKPIRFSHIKEGYFVDKFANNDHEQHDCCHIEIPVTDYYAGLNLQTQQCEPNISKYWNMNLNCLELQTQKN
jgi:hypothetical protein